MNRASTTLASLLLLGALLGCKLLKPGGNACDKAVKLGLESDAKACTAKYADLKQKKPEVYDCTVKCLDKPKDKAAASTCVSACSPPEQQAAKPSGPRFPVKKEIDDLTVATIKQNLKKKQKHRVRLVGAETKGGIWSVALVDGPFIYSLYFMDIASHQEGEAAVGILRKKSTLRNNYHVEIGSEKLLYVACAERRGKELQACSSMFAEFQLNMAKKGSIL